jgi:hypothetical protein
MDIKRARREPYRRDQVECADRQGILRAVWTGT